MAVFVFGDASADIREFDTTVTSGVGEKIEAAVISCGYVDFSARGAEGGGGGVAAKGLGAKHPQFHAVLKTFRAEQTDSVLENPDPRIA